MKAFLHKAAAVLATYGVWGVFALALLDSMGIPLPGALDVTLIGVAVAGKDRPDYVYLSAALAVVGSIAGNVFLFQATRHGRRLLSRKEPAPGEKRKFEAWFHQYGLLSVFVPAVIPLVPLPLKVFVISAGAMRTPFARFLAVITAARIIRYFGLAYLALKLGQDAEGFLRRNGWTITGVTLALALATVYLIRRRSPVEET